MQNAKDVRLWYDQKENLMLRDGAYPKGGNERQEHDLTSFSSKNESAVENKVGVGAKEKDRRRREKVTERKRVAPASPQHGGHLPHQPPTERRHTHNERREQRDEMQEKPVA